MENSPKGTLIPCLTHAELNCFWAPAHPEAPGKVNTLPFQKTTITTTTPPPNTNRKGKRMEGRKEEREGGGKGRRLIFL